MHDDSNQDDFAPDNHWQQLDEETSYLCDHCGEEIVIPVDPSQGRHQQYVEDCPVCCNANLIRVDIDETGHVDISSQPEQDRY